MTIITSVSESTRCRASVTQHVYQRKGTLHIQHWHKPQWPCSLKNACATSGCPPHNCIYSMSSCTNIHVRNNSICNKEILQASVQIAVLLAGIPCTLMSKRANDWMFFRSTARKCHIVCYWLLSDGLNVPDSEALSPLMETSLSIAHQFPASEIYAIDSSCSWLRWWNAVGRHCISYCHVAHGTPMPFCWVPFLFNGHFALHWSSYRYQVISQFGTKPHQHVCPTNMLVTCTRTHTHGMVPEGILQWHFDTVGDLKMSHRMVSAGSVSGHEWIGQELDIDFADLFWQLNPPQ